MILAQARKLAHDLMRLHKLPAAWSFQFDRSKVRFGKCNYAKKEISLSQHLVQLNTETEVRDTILHEIAHALASRRGAWPCVARRGAVDRLQRPAMLRRRSRSADREIQRGMPELSADHSPTSAHRDRLWQVHSGI